MSDVDMKKLLDDNSIEYIENFDIIVERVKQIIAENEQNKFRILVMGAGYSYKLSDNLKKSFS
jgi:hypothetical protein